MEKVISEQNSNHHLETIITAVAEMIAELVRFEPEISICYEN